MFTSIYINCRKKYFYKNIIIDKQAQRTLYNGIVKCYSSKIHHNQSKFTFFKDIKYLLISNEIFNNNFNNLSKSLEGNEWKILNEIDLSGNILNETLFNIFCKSLVNINAPNLKILKLSDCGLTSICGLFLTKYIQSLSFQLLEALYLNGNKLEYEGINIICETLKLINPCNLKIFDIEDNNIKGKGITNLFEVLLLSKMPNIEILNLSGSLNDVTCWKLLSIVLQKEVCKNLKSLQIANNIVSPLSILYIKNSLNTKIFHNIEYINLSKCKLTNNYLKIICSNENIKFNGIKELNLGDNNIKNEGFMLLVKYLIYAKSKTLQYLYLYNCGITDISDKLIEKLLIESNIKLLDLSLNQLNVSEKKELQSIILQKKKYFKLINV